MPDIMVVKKKSYAPARVITLKSKLKKIKILKNAQTRGGVMSSNHACIMEATAYILGYEYVNDEPPCTSPVIREFMIEANDCIESDAKRARLKALIPHIINTAPIRYVQRYRSVIGNHGLPLEYWGVETVDTSPEFKKAEKIRVKMIDTWTRHRLLEMIDKHKLIDAVPEDFDLSEVIDFVSMNKIIEFVKELAAVAKFDGEMEIPA